MKRTSFPPVDKSGRGGGFNQAYRRKKSQQNLIFGPVEY